VAGIRWLAGHGRICTLRRVIPRRAGPPRGRDGYVVPCPLSRSHSGMMFGWKWRKRARPPSERSSWITRRAGRALLTARITAEHRTMLTAPELALADTDAVLTTAGAAERPGAGQRSSCPVPRPWPAVGFRRHQDDGMEIAVADMPTDGAVRPDCGDIGLGATRFVQPEIARCIGAMPRCPEARPTTDGSRNGSAPAACQARNWRGQRVSALAN